MVHMRNSKDVIREAARLVERLTLQESATIVTLSGEMGAGKTAFAQAVAATLGISEQVTSPTFIIERAYSLPQKHASGFLRLVHIDAYRLEQAEELERLGWRDLLKDARNLIIVEWPERVQSLIPKNAVRVALSYVDEQTRKLDYV